MDYAQPELLKLLGFIPFIALLIFWAAHRRRAALARVGEPSLMAALTDSVSPRKRRWKIALRLLALVALILALARPLWGSRVAVKAQQGVEVMVALDVSSSMLAEDIKPNRMDRAKLVIEELMERLRGNDVGLVVYAGAAFVQFPLTTDHSTARAFLRNASPASVSRPGTALEEALEAALGGFPEERATSRAILLLTDGEGHTGDPVAAAQRAAEQDVVIHAIGFGSSEGEPIPVRDAAGQITGYKQDAQGKTVLSRLDESTLRRITREANGIYARASASGAEIDAIVDAIAAMETGEREGQFEIQGVERFEWFAGLALLALAGDALLSERRRHA